MIDIKKELYIHQDYKYKAFTLKLIPTLKENEVIGVRTPILRKIAKELFKSEDYQSFLNDLPHSTHEENMIHTFIIEKVRDSDTAIALLKRFVPFINNWAVCDSMNLKKAFSKNLAVLKEQSVKWIQEDRTYSVRFGVHCLMALFLDKEFTPDILDIVSKVVSDEYYVNMMIAWFFATALAKQWEATISYMERKILPKWVHNKTIQKSKESYRISLEGKQYLETLKIK